MQHSLLDKDESLELDEDRLMVLIESSVQHSLLDKDELQELDEDRLVVRWYCKLLANKDFSRWRNLLTGCYYFYHHRMC